MPVISPGEYEPPAPSSCAGCGAKISDRYYLQAVDRQWHVRCLTCCQCKVQLDSELTCFAKDGHIYCKEDYYRLFAVKRCARCQRGIFANELVMRARDLVFHLHCFTCAWCNSALTQGDYFGLRDDLVYCRPHYELLVRGEAFFAAGTPPGNSGEDSLSYPSTLLPHLPTMLHGEAVVPPSAMEHGGSAGLLADRPPLGDGSNFSPFPSVGTGRKGRPRKRKNVDLRVDGLSPTGIGLNSLDAAGCNLHLSQIDGSGASHHQQQGSPPLSGNGQGSQRTKRMRTSFKHHQLRTMKSYFAINQNPDAKDLKQLAQKTGLSKRVLQVWFQNARAKWRRNNLKQQDSHLLPGEQGLGGPQGILGGPHGPMTGMSSPGATSSFSEPSPVPSCGGIPSDGPMSSQQAPSLDFDGSNPMTPLLTAHHPSSITSLHNGDPPMHLTTFHEMF